jgi:hypothetical protein
VHSIRNGLLCALIAGAFLLGTVPVAQIGFDDDWSYAKTALDFVQTGHFLYNGWATAMLGWQIPWGALFIKLFGFSFTVLRLSTALIAMASVWLFHQILVRFGIAPRLAVFGALTLGLSPLFVPLAASFMTDVPGLFIVMLCLYMCQRAVAASSDRSALLWLSSAAVLNVAGGTVRQIAWLGALVMVPSTAWLLRKQRGMILAGILLGVMSFLAVLGCLHWFEQQSYSVPEEGHISGSIGAATPFHLMFMFLKMLLCLLLVLLPILIAALPGVYKLSARARFCFAASMTVVVAFSIFVGIHGPTVGHNGPRTDEAMPWIGHILSEQGITPSRSGYTLGLSPATTVLWIRLAISSIVVAAGLGLAAQLLDKRKRPKTPPLKERWASWRKPLWLLGPFVLAYFALLLPRAAHGLIFDRYLLAPMAVAVIALLTLSQEEGKVKPAAISWLVLAVFGLYTVAATYDRYALSRALVLAAKEIQESGVPRTAIEGGFEFDGWTQIETAGYVNSPFIRIPKGAYDPNTPLPPVAADCQRSDATLWSAVKPKYFLALEPMDCLAPSKYPAVGYRTWLPPFHRQVYIQQAPKNSD